MNAEEEKERRDGDDCGIILSSSYSFLSERCASPKAALCLSFVGEEKERIFGCVLLGCKISVSCVGPTPTIGFLAFFYSFFERGRHKIKIINTLHHHNIFFFFFFFFFFVEERKRKQERARGCARVRACRVARAV